MRSPSGVLLDQFDAARIAASPDVWTRAYRQLQAGTMPPVGAPRPDRATYDAVLTSIEQALGANAKPPARRHQPGDRRRASPRSCGTARPTPHCFEDAQRNRLSDPAALERQIHRMLADDRARAFVSRFFFPWLGLDQARQGRSGQEALPRLRRLPARCPGDGNRAVPPQSTT